MVLMEKSSKYDDTDYKFSFLVKIMKLHCKVFQLPVITFEKSQGVQIVVAIPPALKAVYNT